MTQADRITDEAWRNFDPWECCGQDGYCKRGCHEEGGCAKGCIVPKLYARLGAYEDLGMSPDEIQKIVTKEIADHIELNDSLASSISDEAKKN